jgi:hypothetical protein
LVVAWRTSNVVGRGSRIRPVVVEAPVLVPRLSEADRAAAVSVLTEILAAW